MVFSNRDASQRYNAIFGLRPLAGAISREAGSRVLIIDLEPPGFQFIGAAGDDERLACCLLETNAINWKRGWRPSFPLRFENRLLPINETIAELWGAMAAVAQLKGITLAVIDGLVAATAKHHELAVVTRNVKDFTVWGAPVLNHWAE